MSGHSKWNNIKRTKEKSDAVKGKIFTKIGREIAVIVKQGGSDPTSNVKLKDVIAKAKQSNMPSDTIERSIKKASGELAGVNYETCIYEGYGVCGSAVIVECLTDNKNRTASDVRHAFDKNGGSLSTSGSVSYLFKRKGLLILLKEDVSDVDSLILEALEVGAIDVVENEDSIEIETLPGLHMKVKEALEKLNYSVISAETGLYPDNFIDLPTQKLSTFRKMIEMLEDSDDVQEVYHNVNLPDNEEV